ncbi:MAG: DNA-3-methyladenine glycosylase I [Rhodobacteraceae bacterium]|nr:DNA-3-methyladenine glycosylase I [Paracoccaceae bacterium]
MRSYAEIHAIAAARHGGDEALESRLTRPLPPSDLAQIPEDRWLAAFCRTIFAAGLNWTVVEKKWDGIEAAFRGFDVNACAMMDDVWLDALLADTRVIRSGAKITAVRDNAVLFQDLRPQGGAPAVFADWPSTDFAGLLDLLKSRGARLGGNTAAYALRSLGRDSYILSGDVTARLIAEGVIDKPASSKSARRAVQAAFNIWMDQSGRSLTEISRTLAFSI